MNKNKNQKIKDDFYTFRSTNKDIKNIEKEREIQNKNYSNKDNNNNENYLTDSNFEYNKLENNNKCNGFEKNKS